MHTYSVLCGEQEILRFNVTMDQTFAVDMVQSTEDLEKPAEYGLLWERTTPRLSSLLNLYGEVTSFHIFHHNANIKLAVVARKLLVLEEKIAQFHNVRRLKTT